jgi:hypothetical protein
MHLSCRYSEGRGVSDDMSTLTLHGEGWFRISEIKADLQSYFANGRLEGGMDLGAFFEYAGVWLFSSVDVF